MIGLGHCTVCRDKKNYEYLVGQNNNALRQLKSSFKVTSSRSSNSSYRLYNMLREYSPHFMCGRCSYDRGELRRSEEELKRVIVTIVEKELVTYKTREKLLRYLRGIHPDWYRVVERELAKKKQ